jgi:hypothetical protein
MASSFASESLDDERLSGRAQPRRCNTDVMCSTEERFLYGTGSSADGRSL